VTASLTLSFGVALEGVRSQAQTRVAVAAAEAAPVEVQALGSVPLHYVDLLVTEEAGVGRRQLTHQHLLGALGSSSLREKSHRNIPSYCCYNGIYYC